jgi:hypothetical protein
MASALEARVQAVDAAHLLPIVLKATGCAGGRLVEWSVDPIRPLIGGLGASAIYRFSGAVQHQGENTHWSLILKIISGAIEKPGGGATDDMALQREALFYRSDLIQDMPSGFRPAHCYALDTQSDESGLPEHWLWLEDLSSLAHEQWSADDLHQVACGLGLLNGAFLNANTRARAPWARTGNIRFYVEQSEPQFRALFANRTHPLVQQAFPPASIDRITDLWQSREKYLQTMDEAPQTLCHGDAQKTNLFLDKRSAGQPETVAIDWEGICHGPVGLDVAQLLSGILFYLENDVDRLVELSEALYAGYLTGIQAAGWQGDPRLVRFGYTASMFRTQVILMKRSVQVLLDPIMQKTVTPYLQAHGATLEDVAERVRQIQQIPHDLFVESKALQAQLT